MSQDETFESLPPSQSRPADFDYEIIFGSETPTTQIDAVVGEIGDSPVKFTREPVDTFPQERVAVVIGSVILSLTFVSKSFFDAFFKEFGKDTYVWFKSKLGIMKARSRGDFNVTYSIGLENILFTDWTARASAERHDKILPAIKVVYETIHAQHLANEIKTVVLVFDSSATAYTEAHLHKSPFYEKDPQVLILKSRK